MLRPATVQCWDVGTLGRWDIGTSGRWDIGTSLLIVTDAVQKIPASWDSKYLGASIQVDTRGLGRTFLCSESIPIEGGVVNTFRL